MAQVYLAACLGLLGRQTRAQAALDEAHEILPGFSTTWVRTFLPYKRDADMKRVLDGLRRAGLRFVTRDIDDYLFVRAMDRQDM